MKQIRNLYDELMDVAVSDKFNPESTNWAKTVERVDMNIQNGWMYTGDFIKTGTIEVEIEPTVFIVMNTIEGEIPLYQVVIMDEEGDLHLTDIHTWGDVPGWAMRIRDDILELLILLDIRKSIALDSFGHTIPEETIKLLENEALRAQDAGEDVAVYPDVLLALIHHYRERMRR